jgi:hypothetical protein
MSSRSLLPLKETTCSNTNAGNTSFRMACEKLTMGVMIFFPVPVSGRGVYGMINKWNVNPGEITGRVIRNRFVFRNTGRIGGCLCPGEADQQEQN